MRTRIYISAPLTSGGTASDAERDRNLDSAIRAFMTLSAAGYAPLCPHLSLLIDRRHPGAIEWDQWMEIDLPWVEVSHAVLRMAGASKGADQECAHAESKGIPVFRNIVDLTAYFTLTMKNGQPESGIHGDGKSRRFTDSLPNETPTASETVLEEAARLVDGDRREAYDHPRPNHDRIGRIWGVQLERYMRDHKPGDPVPARIVALMMVGVKLAREAFAPRRDNIVDGVGYFRCVELIDEAEA